MISESSLYLMPEKRFDFEQNPYLILLFIVSRYTWVSCKSYPFIHVLNIESAFYISNM